MGNTDPWAAAAARLSAPPAPETPAPAPDPQSDPWIAAATRVSQPAAPTQPAQSSDPWEVAAARATQPPIQPPGIASQMWQWANKPLLDFTRTAAGPIERGAEQVASSFTSPLSAALLISSFGESAIEQGLIKTGLMTATDAAGAVRKLKLGADTAFLTKYGIDTWKDTVPQLEMNWNDYRGATNERDKQKALDRFEELGTETVLNSLAMGLASKGIEGDLAAVRAASPKGRAMANEHLANAVFNFSHEDNAGTAQAGQILKEYKAKIPDQDRRIAIARNIEAGGDAGVLERQALAAEANPATKKTAQEFRDAKKLSDDEIEVRDGLRNILAADLAHLKFLKLLPEDGGKTNYLPHLWDFEDKDPETGKPVVRTGYDDTGMLKKRTFETIAEGEQKGAKPTTKDAVDLIADYHQRVSNLIAKNNYSETLAGSYMNDGSPMSAPGKIFAGFTRPVDAPVQPWEIQKLKAAGKLDALLKSGRIYEVEPKTGKPVTETALALSPKRLEGPTRELPSQAEDLKDRAFMFKQHDFVNPGNAYVWRPTSELAPEDRVNAITTFGNGPVPEQAIMEPGMRGIPTDRPPIQHVEMARVPLYVNPEVAPQVEANLESRTPKNPLLKEILKYSSEAKSDLLALSPFHWATITSRSLESGLNPFGGNHNLLRQISAGAQDILGVKKPIFLPKDIDYFNLTPAQESALRDGITVGASRTQRLSSEAAEGNVSEGSFLDRLPIVGGFNRQIEERLFSPHGWITSLKFDLYDKLKGEIMKSKPTLTDVQAGRIAAAQVNNKFGGLNYTVLGRGATAQTALRAMLLAPDFLESTGRSILDVVGSNGTPLVKSLIAFNAAQWALTRGVNWLVSGNTHPESGMSVLSKNGKREYRLRTTLGDFLHFVTAPKDFIANRENPLLLRAPAELAEGEDPMGNKVSTAQQFWDTLRQITPIPLQGLYPSQQLTQPSETDQLLQSVGVQSRKKFSPAETLAHQIESRKPEGEPLEGDDLARAQMRYKLEDQLRTAINAKDVPGRVEALKAIDKAASGPNPVLSRKDRTQITQQAHKYPLPLQSAVVHLGLVDALQVWDKSSILERRALRPIIQSKIENWNGKVHTPQERADMQQRIRAFRFSLGG